MRLGFNLYQMRLRRQNLSELKAAKSFAIRDMFRRQKYSGSKMLRVEDEDLYMIIID